MQSVPLRQQRRRVSEAGGRGERERERGDGNTERRTTLTGIVHIFS